MSKSFRLHTKYQPTGDQPAAISSLISGLDGGRREQTLLGVTGSGKSITADMPVMIRQNGVIKQLTIGAIIDSLLKKYSNQVQRSTDTSFINCVDMLKEDCFDVWSFNPKTGQNSWKPVTQISRHHTSNLLKITTKCGRKISITKDHNLYIARNGKITLVDGKELAIGDLIPASRKLPPPEANLDGINVLEWISCRKGLYVKLKSSVKERDVRSIPVSRTKQWAILNKSEQIKAETFLAIDERLGLAVGANKKGGHIPLKIKLTPEFLQFLGYYIAEGHAEKRYVTFTTADMAVVKASEKAMKQINLKVLKRQKPYDYQISASVLARLLADLCGNKANVKRMPAFWPQLTNKQLAEILKAYFSGDGGIDGQAITCVTASNKLAVDLQYALARFGILARCRRKIVKSPDGRSRTYFVVSISGRNNLKVFSNLIGFSLQRKNLQLERLLSGERFENTNCDLIPISSSDILKARTILGWSQSDLATRIGVKRSYISLLEYSRRTMSYAVAKKLLKTLRAQDDRRLDEIIERIACLAEIFWTPISTISEIESDQPVYDFAVAQNETFYAGHGGVFVHNTFTMANIIAQQQKPTLVLAHNKTLAAQLFSEFKNFFPDNQVHYFVSYFDYYQPEAYIASSDVYIEKDSKINDEIDRLRHAATSALLTNRDTIIVASVSCIYGIGSPSNYAEMSVNLAKGQKYNRAKLIRHLNDIQYKRNDIDFRRGTFRVRGDTVDVFPSGSKSAVRVELFDDTVERIMQIDGLTGEIISQRDTMQLFPTSHYVTPEARIKAAIEQIKAEYEDRLAYFEKTGDNLAAQRLSQRIKFDLEMLETTGFVKGIENYSRYLTDRAAGEQPATLIDYFPDDFLMFIDESHMTLPQVRGMFNGDRARKEVLIDYGFRLPSALDNRPLTFDEFEKHINQVIYVSATPGEYELQHSGQPIEQVIRPTGLLDPRVEVRPSEHQVDDLISEIRARVAKQQRVLVTTLTKRMAEDLTGYLDENDIKTAYIHSDVDTLERGDILKDLRLGVYDVLVGINLLREGLDLPEVSLVAIIDADKEGFLRSEQALTQTIGRAARHIDGTVIMYADNTTGSMRRAIDETNRRRQIQDDYNKKHGITPQSIAKAIDEGLRAIIPKDDKKPKLDLKKIPKEEYAVLVDDLTGQMELAAANLQFEQAAELRDLIDEIRAKL